MTHPLSPTTVLPALAILHACNATRVGEVLRALRDVYFPYTTSTIPAGTVPVLRQSLSGVVPVSRPKRTARLVHHDEVPDSGYASAEDEQDDRVKETTNTHTIDWGEMGEGDEALDTLRSDEFERGYAIKWLTGLVKRGDAWVHATPSAEEQEVRTTHLEDVSKLLALFAGESAPEDTLTRTFVFPFRVPPCSRCHYWDISSTALSIRVELNDGPVDRADHTAVGLQSWGSAIVFAERMCSDPERYLGTLHPCTFIPMSAADAETKKKMRIYPFRILELGAGTGLLAITVARIFSQTFAQAEIKATDYHPSVLENLARNVRHNASAMSVSVEKLDWCNKEEGAVCRDEYDVVLAADVVYHPEHASWIRGCIERTLSKDGVFWLIIPKRTIGRHEGLEQTVEEAFPFADDAEELGEGPWEHLAIVRRETLERVDRVGRADEAGYTLFEIRWVGMHE